MNAADMPTTTGHSSSHSGTFQNSNISINVNINHSSHGALTNSSTEIHHVSQMWSVINAASVYGVVTDGVIATTICVVNIR